jgi:hypothetical protein
MGTVSPRQSPDAPAHVQTGSTSPRIYEIANGSTEDEEQMFSMIKKPRVRYDVEVVTRLIVYMGEILLRWYSSYGILTWLKALA